MLVSNDVTSKTERMGKEHTMKQRFSVLDTETNWNDEVMSIGIVIADQDTFNVIDEMYLVLDPEYRVGGMYSSALSLKDYDMNFVHRGDAIGIIKNWLAENDSRSIFAYNASFDHRHLQELNKYDWYDIMKIAAYKQYNTMIPESLECYGTGRLKKNYGVEPMIRMLSGNKGYMETHNALLDSKVELSIMKMMKLPVENYKCALIYEGIPKEVIPKEVITSTPSCSYAKTVKSEFDSTKFVLHVCDKCKKKYRVKSNKKQIKCPRCKNIYLTSLGIESDE